MKNKVPGTNTAVIVSDFDPTLEQFHLSANDLGRATSKGVGMS